MTNADQSNQPVEERRQREEQAERCAHETYQEMGRVGEKSAEQVYQDMLARGELTRGEREIEHGEFGAAYDEIERTPGQGDES